MSSGEIIQKIFDLKNLSFGRYGWIWWFWLFFFKDQLNSKKPKQMAILWSAKNDANIKCNEVEVGSKNPLKEDGSLQGGIAAWYFNGLKMHDNFLLNSVKINQTLSGISTSSPDTAFQFKESTFQISIGDQMKFEATLMKDGNKFTAPWVKGNKYFGLGYEMIGINKLNLKAVVDGKISEGTAYFQKVFLKAPAIPWRWGIFHFEHGTSLSYFNPYLLGKSFKKDVSFYDGETLHKFNDIAVKKTGNPLPTFGIRAMDKEKMIEFLVETYSRTTWKFHKNKLGFIPVKFDYRQYPAKITSFKFKDMKNDLTLSEKDVGVGIGNAEHSTGVLI